jgi:hypothetical protein
MKKSVTKVILVVAYLIGINTYSNAQFTQQGSKLVGTGASGSSAQGVSVSISSDGSTAIVGGSEDNNSKGAVWFYTRTGGVWTQQGNKLTGTGAKGSDGPYMGGSVAISADGNTAIAGGMGDNGFTGAAWIFTRSGGVWSQQGGKLVGSGAGQDAFLGQAVAISADGNTVIIGGQNANGVWIFTRSNGVWIQQGNKLTGTGGTGSPSQGRSVALSGDGNTAIVGGFTNGAAHHLIGATWVFMRSGGIWTQQGNKLVGSGSTGNGNVYQGISVSVSSNGNTFIVGGWYDNFATGAAWIFTRSGSVWSQQGNKLVGTGSVGGDIQQGWSVSISADGNKAIIGGPGDNGRIGAAWVFIRNSGVWTQQGSKLVGTGSVGNPGQAGFVCISGDRSTAIVGGSGDNGGAGAVWVYTTGKVSNVAETNPVIKNINEEIIPGLILYPNPAKDNLTVEFTSSSEGNVKVNVYNQSAQKVMNIERYSVKGLNTFGLNTSNFGTGVYIVEITNNGQKQHQQFLISR